MAPVHNPELTRRPRTDTRPTHPRPRCAPSEHAVSATARRACTREPAQIARSGAVMRPAQPPARRSASVGPDTVPNAKRLVDGALTDLADERACTRLHRPSSSGLSMPPRVTSRYSTAVPVTTAQSLEVKRSGVRVSPARQTLPRRSNSSATWAVSGHDQTGERPRKLAG